MAINYREFSIRRQENIPDEGKQKRNNKNRHFRIESLSEKNGIIIFVFLFAAATALRADTFQTKCFLFFQFHFHF